MRMNSLKVIDESIEVDEELNVEIKAHMGSSDGEVFADLKTELKYMNLRSYNTQHCPCYGTDDFYNI